MKHIAIDMFMSQPQKVTQTNGGGDYCTFMLNELVKLSGLHITVLLYVGRGHNDVVDALCKNNGLQKLYYDDNADFEKIINNGNFDTLYFPVLHPYHKEIKIKREQRIIAGIHDLSTIEQAKVFYKVKGKKFLGNDGWDWLRNIYRTIFSTSILKQEIKTHNKLFNLSDNEIVYTVSYSTRTEMNFLLSTNETSIPVFYTPDIVIKNTEDCIDTDILEKTGIKKQSYFLLCSANRWNKNNEIAIKTIDNFFSYNRKCSHKALVLGAVPNVKSYLLTQIVNKEKFVFKGYVDRAELETYFKNAYCLVYPSVIEGFGLPPVEAMKYGVVSLCSTATSIPEICADAAIYFDPYSHESIYKALLKAFDNEYMELVKHHVKRRYKELSDKRADDLRLLLNLISNVYI